MPVPPVRNRPDALEDSPPQPPAGTAATEAAIREEDPDGVPMTDPRPLKIVDVFAPETVASL